MKAHLFLIASFISLLLIVNGGIIDWCQPGTMPPGCDTNSWVQGPACDSGLMAKVPICEHCSAQGSTVSELCCSQCWNPSTCVNIPKKGCKCACSCFHKDTPIAVSLAGGIIPIGSLAAGDKVLTMESTATKDAKWVETAIYKAHTTPISPLFKFRAIEIQYQLNGQAQKLVSSLEQLYFVFDKTLNKKVLISVLELQKDRHLLLDMNYKQIPITKISSGRMKGGISSIVTSTSTSQSKHLILAGGIISGDFYLQQTYTPGSEQVMSNTDLMEFNDELTKADTQSYISHDHLTAKHYGDLPSNMNSFLPRFVEDLDLTGQLKDIGDEDMSRVSFLANLFSGAHPQTKLEVHWESDIFNSFTYIDNTNTTHIVMHGGLLRHKKLTWNGLALIFARQYAQISFARYTDGEWKQCEKNGDIYITGPLSGAFAVQHPAPYYLNFYKKGLREIKGLFESIPAVDPLNPDFGIKSNCSQPTNRINTHCRIKIMRAGIVDVQDASECWKVDQNDDVATTLNVAVDGTTSPRLLKKRRVSRGFRNIRFCQSSVCQTNASVIKDICQKTKASDAILPKSVSKTVFCRCKC